MRLCLTSRLAENEHELLLLPPQNRPQWIRGRHDGGLARVPEGHDDQVLDALVFRIPKHLEVQGRGSAGDVVSEVKVEEQEVTFPRDSTPNLTVFEHPIGQLLGDNVILL